MFLEKSTSKCFKHLIFWEFTLSITPPPPKKNQQILPKKGSTTLCLDYWEHHRNRARNPQPHLPPSPWRVRYAFPGAWGAFSATFCWVTSSKRRKEPEMTGEHHLGNQNSEKFSECFFLCFAWYFFWDLSDF